MNESKLDLILEVVTDIKVRQENLEKTVGEIKLKFDKLDSRVDKLDSKFDTLSTEFSGFKNQVIEQFASFQNRFSILEKQMVAIGIEIKAEIKVEIKAVREDINRLENEILFARSDLVGIRTKIQKLETRVTQLEENIGTTL